MSGRGDSLINAIRAAIRKGVLLPEIAKHHWATTYRTTPENLEASWLHELTKETNSSALEGK
jgi:hypothetical protein